MISAVITLSLRSEQLPSCFKLSWVNLSDPFNKPEGGGGRREGVGDLPPFSPRTAPLNVPSLLSAVTWARRRLLPRLKAC